MTWSPAHPEPLPRIVGWAATGVLAVFLAVGTAQHLGGPGELRALLAALAGLALGALSFLGPRAALVPAAVGSGAAVGVLGHASASNVGWFGLCVLVAWCALATTLPIMVTFWAAAMVVLVLELTLTTHDPGWTAWLAGTTFSLVGCVLGSRQRDLVLQLRAAQAGLALRAQAEERTRIARELHDVIAHSLTISLMHVTAARLAVADDPDDAARALAEAERLGRASLTEVRHAVGLLHGEGTADPTAPLPGSTDLPHLIDGFRRAGGDVTAHVDGDPAQLPATTGLVVYRIVQESLTNAVKHAAGQPVQVAVRVEPGVVRVRVDSAGTPGQGAGLGLTSMRERAESVGGHCTAGPYEQGWRVSAELPVTAGTPSG